MDALIIALVEKLANWLVGKAFFQQVLALASKFDGRVDLDGDGKKEAVWAELKSSGALFGTRAFNLAIELALAIIVRKK